MSRLGRTVTGAVAVMALVMGAAGCSAPADLPTAPSPALAEFTGDPRVALRAAQQRWAAHGPRNYDYTVTTVCFCFPIVRTVRFEVRDGVGRAPGIDAATERRFSGVVPVERAFDDIWTSIERGSHRLQVEYDAGLGYPTFYVVDYRALTADDEFGVFIADFVPR